MQKWGWTDVGILYLNRSDVYRGDGKFVSKVIERGAEVKQDVASEQSYFRARKSLDAPALPVKSLRANPLGQSGYGDWCSMID